MEINFVKSWNFFFKAICFIGCTFQLSNIAVSYFQYDTVSKNSFSTPKTLDFPVLHFCFIYLTDSINWSKVELKYGKLFPRDTFSNKLQWMDILTVGDILNFTPPLQFSGCSYRDQLGNEVIHTKRCEMFEIHKYVSQQYICYQLTPKERVAMDFYFIHTSLLNDRLIYEVQLDKQLSRSFFKIRNSSDRRWVSVHKSELRSIVPQEACGWCSNHGILSELRGATDRVSVRSIHLRTRRLQRFLILFQVSGKVDTQTFRPFAH